MSCKRWASLLDGSTVGPGVRAQTPLRGREMRGYVGGVIPVYSNCAFVDEMQSGDAVAEIGVNGRTC